MEPLEWAVISYTLPREPSRARVSVWRRLKKIGAVNMQQSMWVLPMTGANYELLNSVRDEVVRNGGEAFVMKSTADAEADAAIARRFNEARNEEYGELLEQCEDFYKEIEMETARRNFTFAEVEENEEELDKLREWHRKIAARDSFSAGRSGEARAALLKCGELLEQFCAAVYTFNEGV
jgi:CRISPR/Cas system-associated endoribonuclease Cas2